MRYPLISGVSDYFVVMEIELSDKRIIAVEPQEDGQWLVDGKGEKVDFLRVSDNEYHLIIDSTNYSVFVEKLDPEAQTAELRINGQYLTLRGRGQYESLLESLGMDSIAASKAKDLKAPMPGLVVSVLVENGQEVNPGDSLLILEAMKMENVIKADAPGKVDTVLVNAKDSVEKGEVLISFES